MTAVRACFVQRLVGHALCTLKAYNIVQVEFLSWVFLIDMLLFQWQIEDFQFRGCRPLWEGANLQHGHFSVEKHAKMKGLGEGVGPAGPLPVSATGYFMKYLYFTDIFFYFLNPISQGHKIQQNKIKQRLTAFMQCYFFDIHNHRIHLVMDIYSKLFHGILLFILSHRFKFVLLTLDKIGTGSHVNKPVLFRPMTHDHDVILSAIF